MAYGLSVDYIKTNAGSVYGSAIKFSTPYAHQAVNILHLPEPTKQVIFNPMKNIKQNVIVPVTTPIKTIKNVAHFGSQFVMFPTQFENDYTQFKNS